jgi:hypothetical protein
MEADPDHFTELSLEKLRLLEARPLPLRSPEETGRLARLGPITDEELRATRRMLDACDTFPSRFSDDGR